MEIWIIFGAIATAGAAYGFSVASQRFVYWLCKPSRRGPSAAR